MHTQKSFSLLVLAVLCGIGVGYVAMPVAFRLIPTDSRRISVLLEALQDNAGKPSIIVLGNSTVMSGVDCRQLSQELREHPLALNMSSPGQPLVESYLYYQELPPNIKAVVQMIDLRFLIADETLDRQRFSAFYMYGYRPTARTVQTLTSLLPVPTESILNASDASQRFQARWIFRQLLETTVRRIVRPDLKILESMTDLYFPRTFTRPETAVKIDRLLEQRIKELPEQGDAEIARRNRLFLTEMLRQAQADGRTMILLLPPVHPKIQQSRERLVTQFQDFIRTFAQEQQVVVVDTTNLLAADAFVDHVHLLSRGARLVTGTLSEFLATLI